MFLTIMSILLLIIFFTVSLIFWRCPNCKEGLPIRLNIDKEKKLTMFIFAPIVMQKFVMERLLNNLPTIITN